MRLVSTSSVDAKPTGPSRSRSQHSPPMDKKAGKDATSHKFCRVCAGTPDLGLPDLRWTLGTLYTLSRTSAGPWGPRPQYDESTNRIPVTHSLPISLAAICCCFVVVVVASAVHILT